MTLNLHFLLLYRMEDEDLLRLIVLQLMYGEIWGKTVHNLLLCVVQHLNASYDMKILTFSELILLNYFYKRSEILCYFHRGNYIAFHFYKRGDLTITPSRGVILHRYFFKRSTSCHLRSLCKEAYLHSCPYKWGSNSVVYLYSVRLCGSILLDSLLLRSLHRDSYIAWFTSNKEVSWPCADLFCNRSWKFAA